MQTRHIPARDHHCPQPARRACADDWPEGQSSQTPAAVMRRTHRRLLRCQIPGTTYPRLHKALALQSGETNELFLHPEGRESDKMPEKFIPNERTRESHGQRSKRGSKTPDGELKAILRILAGMKKRTSGTPLPQR